MPGGGEAFLRVELSHPAEQGTGPRLRKQHNNNQLLSGISVKLPHCFKEKLVYIFQQIAFWPFHRTWLEGTLI